ncbi:11392_t:CDS:2, partial [Dentiscutata erythropus]
VIFVQHYFFDMVLELAESQYQLYGNIVGVWMNEDYVIITYNSKLAQQIFDQNQPNLKNFITNTDNVYSLKEVGIHQKGIIRNKDIPKWSSPRRILQFDLDSDICQKVSDIVIIFETALGTRDVKAQDFFLLSLCNLWQLLCYRKSVLSIVVNSNSQIYSFLHHFRSYTTEIVNFASVFYTKNKNFDNQIMNLISSSSDSILKDDLLESVRLIDVEMIVARKFWGDCDVSKIHIQASIDRFIKLVCMNHRFVFAKLEEKSKIINTKTKWKVTQQPVIENFINILPRKKIVIIGAHSVGKSTIARIIKIHNNNAILVNEIARTIIEKFKIDVNTLKDDPEKYFKFQAFIIRSQCIIEEQIEHKFAILDRSILDTIVYTQIYCKKLWKKLLCMKKPKKECLENDGIRMVPKDIDELVTFSNDLKKLMDEFNIKYHLVSDLDVNQRYSKIMKIIGLSNSNTNNAEDIENINYFADIIEKNMDNLDTSSQVTSITSNAENDVSNYLLEKTTKLGIM